ncbi:LLM class flavin-dependent oxidoreductase [Streptomyces hokutonensis]|jgi:luciferase family oxidoreductase group 1|uniref:LLM class flavin-dependent oxidoreductase n=1 Tax=Streptomyces hokutonensis TaxID=1306990 RepID=A0ABW6M8U4_9ACTN
MTERQDPVPQGPRLSVLDFSPVVSGSGPGQALRDSVTVAERVDRLGYLRYWIAEHHNAPNIASCSPPVLIDRIAAATTHMRIGSGGVMLPNHSPLVVAEQFGTLEALHPGRIDMGIGRASGTDPVTARALRRTTGTDDFAERFAELMGYFATPADGSPVLPVTAVPAQGNRPPLWLLGSSPNSAQVAGMLGLPFAFAHHFSPENTIPSLKAYRSAFTPSADLERPYAIVAAIVIVADTDEHAEWLAGPMALSSLLQRTTGITGPYPSPEEAAAYPYTPQERAYVAQRVDAHLIGGPEKVRAKMADFLDRTGADELMSVTLIHGPDDRVRSLELLAEIAALPSHGVAVDPASV